MSADTIPGTIKAPEPLTPPEPPAEPGGALPPAPPAPDAKPKRPTTRAGRAAAAAAKKSQPAAKADKSPKGAKAPRRASLETRLTGNLMTLGTMVAAAGAMSSPAVQLDGVAICQHAPAIAAALNKVAQDDPRVAQALERMLTAGVWSGLIAAMLPLVLAIAANHGALPPQIAAMVGVQAPEPPAPGTVPVV